MTRPSVDWEDAYRRGTTLDPTGTYDMLDGMDASSLRLMVQDMLRARSMDELEVMREKWSCNEIALNSALRAEATTKQLFQSLSTLRAEKERHDAALEEKDNHLSKVQKELSAVKEAYRAGKKRACGDYPGSASLSTRSPPRVRTPVSSASNQEGCWRQDWIGIIV
eukprot:Rmarinus@m.6147